MAQQYSISECNEEVTPRKFDILLYCAQGTPSAFIREFELLPLRIGIILNQEPNDHFRTMLPISICSLDNLYIHLISTRLLVNLDSDSLETVCRLIEGCVATKTNYIDCCEKIAVIKHVFALYDNIATKTGIAIIQGCGFETLLTDLGLHIIGKIHDVNQVECLIRLKESNAYYSDYDPDGVLSFERKKDLIEYLAKKSQNYFKKIGMNSVKITIAEKDKNSILKQICGYAYSLLNFSRLFKKIKNIKLPNQERKTLEVFFMAKHVKSESRSVLMVKCTDTDSDATAICLTQAAISVFEITDYGVFSPAAAFHKTQIIERLNSKKISFDFLL